jgi:alkylation response protein AidB-like acyl-CoA dehydrogenase
MRFVLTDEQRDFASALDRLLAASDTAAVARAWAEGDTDPGIKLWQRLAEQGLTMLATEATPVEIVVAFEALGRYAVPGPWVESAAHLPVLLGREVDGVGTVGTPLALDADLADEVYLLDGDAVRSATVDGPSERASVDPTRRLFTLTAGDPVASEHVRAAWENAVLAASAQLLGLGEHLLAESVAYAKQRRQFGREIGSYQAVKHALADVRIALDFARPLVFGAAVHGSCASERPMASSHAHDPFSRDVSAAKVAAGDAAYLASRVALQVHGAIGYTREYDLSLWITKVRALVGAWGTPAFHRARVLESLTPTGSGRH